jgi:F-box/TPR repeat protein Pof3
MPRPLSPDECQELGRRYYKLKQFQKALDTFNDGIDASPTISLYDHRAACYDKLGDYNAAVKDGRAMIKLDKQDVRGYLRTASLLEKMDKPETALGIYKYGMKNVPVEDKNFRVILVHAPSMSVLTCAASPATPRQDYPQALTRKSR